MTAGTAKEKQAEGKGPLPAFLLLTMISLSYRITGI